MRIETSSPTVMEGQTLDLNCVVVGQPQASVTWFKRGGNLPSRYQVPRGTEAVGWPFDLSGWQGSFSCPVHSSRLDMR